MNGLDYVGQSNMLLTFNATTRSAELEVDLIDDSVYETVEDFNGTLTLVSNSERVTFNPENAVATIEDDEGMCDQNHIAEYRACSKQCTPPTFGD